MKNSVYFRSLAIILVLLFLLNVPTSGMQSPKEISILPKPEKLTLRKGKLSIDQSFCVSLTGKDSPDLYQAVSRFRNRLQKRTGIPLPFEIVKTIPNTTLEINCVGDGEHVQSVRTDESYTLEVNDKKALLSAAAPLGIFRGLETFLQLIDMDSSSFYVPLVKIEDRPRFPWRGLLIDVSRHFQSVDMIKKNLEAMAVVKMNVLHWHLSDDQGFRVESKSFPKLHLMGSDGNYYSHEQIEDIVSYARRLGIRVVPEFDMPGHSTSWLVGYPELASAPGPYTIERKWGVFEPCMDPSKEEVYAFLDTFIGEMAGLFPDEYFHIGGDEVKATQWNSSNTIQSFQETNNITGHRELQAYFNRRLLDILNKHGKKMIGWDEIFHPDLPQNIVIQSWRGQASLAASAEKGYQGILSYGYYLDHMRPASFHYAMDPLSNEALDLSEEEKSRILGGEACMWGEFINSENIESRIWPRTAAIAERLWSSASTNDIPDLYRRMEVIDRELQAIGLQHYSLYEKRLQRLAGKADIQPLRIFADLLKPPILSIRKQARTYTSQTPLNRLVDTLLPESEVARELSQLVDDCLSGLEHPSNNFMLIRTRLALWRDNISELNPIIDQSYLLNEIQPLADTVAKLCTFSMEAIDYLNVQNRPPEIWRQEASDLLKTAENPQAEIFIAILPSMKKLIEAAAAIP